MAKKSKKEPGSHKERKKKIERLLKKAVKQQKSKKSKKRARPSSSSDSSSSSTSSSSSSDIRGPSRIKRNVKRKLKRIEAELAKIEPQQTGLQTSTASSSTDVPPHMQAPLTKAPWNINKPPMPPPPKAWTINPPPAARQPQAKMNIFPPPHPPPPPPPPPMAQFVNVGSNHDAAHAPAHFPSAPMQQFPPSPPMYPPQPPAPPKPHQPSTQVPQSSDDVSWGHRGAVHRDPPWREQVRNVYCRTCRRHCAVMHSMLCHFISYVCFC